MCPYIVLPFNKSFEHCIDLWQPRLQSLLPSSHFTPLRHSPLPGIAVITQRRLSWLQIWRFVISLFFYTYREYPNRVVSLSHSFLSLVFKCFKKQDSQHKTSLQQRMGVKHNYFYLIVRFHQIWSLLGYTVLQNDLILQNFESWVSGTFYF